MLEDTLESNARKAAAPPVVEPCSMALGPRQAAVVAGTGHDAIYDAIREKKLAARKLGRRSIIMRADLEAWLKSLPPLELTPKVPKAGSAKRGRRHARNATAPEHMGV